MSAYHIFRCVRQHVDDATFEKIVADCETIEWNAEFRRLLRRIKNKQVIWTDTNCELP